MRPIFGTDNSLQLRLILFVIISIVVILADFKRLKMFVRIHLYMDTLISPVYFLINSSRHILDHTLQIVTVRANLALENQVLRQKLLINNSELLLLEQYKQENARLRELLNLPLRHDEKKMVAGVIYSSTNNPYRDQIVIDKGLDNNIYIGQPVVNEKGIIGQVIATSKVTSRVLLICDSSHALPIQILRNNIRVIANGNGCNDDLNLDYLPSSTDIIVGDILVTSGLGGRFPEGYPVAVVTSIKEDIQRAYMIIHARPIANLQHLRYILLVWVKNWHDRLPLSPNEVHNMANERLMKITS